MPDDSSLSPRDLRAITAMVREAVPPLLAREREAGRAEGRAEVRRELELLARFNGSAGHVLKAFDESEARDERAADPHGAIADAMLELAEEGDLDGVGRLRDLLADPAELGRVLADGGADGALVGKCVWAVLKAWRAEDHPRGKGGHFISKDRIDAAKSDPKLAAQLKKEVKPEDAGKLDAALEGKTDLGRTKRGQASHEAAGRRQTKDDHRAKTQAILAHLAKVGDLKAKLTPDHLYELADHLQAGLMTVQEIRQARQALRGAAVQARFDGATRKDQMAAALVKYAKKGAFDARLKEQGVAGDAADEMRQAAGLGATTEGGGDAAGDVRDAGARGVDSAGELRPGRGRRVRPAGRVAGAVVGQPGVGGVAAVRDAGGGNGGLARDAVGARGPARRGDSGTEAVPGPAAGRGEDSAGGYGELGRGHPLGAGAAAPGLTARQKTALEEYTDVGGQHFKKVNALLRGAALGPEDERKAEELHAALRAAFAAEGETPPPGTVLHRGESYSEADAARVFDEARRAAETGEPVARPGYTSTTADEGAARDFAEDYEGAGKPVPVLYRIRPARVLDMAPHSRATADTGDESEFLLDHNSRFRVTGVTPPGEPNKFGRRRPGVIEMEQVPAPQPPADVPPAPQGPTPGVVTPPAKPAKPKPAPKKPARRGADDAAPTADEFAAASTPASPAASPTPPPAPSPATPAAQNPPPIPSTPVDKPGATAHTTPTPASGTGGPAVGGGKMETKELPKLAGTANQIEAAGRIRERALDPASYGGNIRAAHEFMLPVVASGASAATAAADWLDNKKYAFPLLFAGRFGIDPKAARAAQRVIEEHHAYNSLRASGGESTSPELDEAATSDLVGVVGRAKADEVARAFGYRLSGGGQ